MAELKQEQQSHRMGMHTEQLAGRTQQIFFSPEEATSSFEQPLPLELRDSHWLWIKIA